MSEDRRRRAAGLAAALVLASCVLAGCGWRPLHSNHAPAGENELSGQSAIQQRLSEVQVSPLRDRTGQLMHNVLVERLNPAGQPAQPRYRLSMGLSESITEIGLESDETASRANLTLRASFQLVDTASGEVLYRGLSRSTNSYDIIENQFASDVAEQDARQRGIRQVANEVLERLGAYFASTST